MLALLEIEYPHTHGWNEAQLEKIAQQIRDRQLLERLAEANLKYTVRLPRLLFLANFWAQFYLQSKYGLEAGYLASAKDLFEHAEAQLAVTRADEFQRAALTIRYLDEAKLAALTS